MRSAQLASPDREAWDRKYAHPEPSAATRTPPATQSAFHEATESSRSPSFGLLTRKAEGREAKRWRTKTTGDRKARAQRARSCSAAGGVPGQRPGASLLLLILFLVLHKVGMLSCVWCPQISQRRASGSKKGAPG